MFDEHDLTALLLAYIDGDTLARKALIDVLDEAGDPRAEKIRDEAIHWDKVAANASDLNSFSYLRFQIDCARYGSTATPEVTALVRHARANYIAQLFPEMTR